MFDACFSGDTAICHRGTQVPSTLVIGTCYTHPANAFNTLVIRCFSSCKSRGNGGTNTLYLKKPQRKYSQEVRSQELAGQHRAMGNHLPLHGQSTDGVDDPSGTHVRYYANVAEHRRAA
ncbi:hypothetical protein AVEN_96806-1 [Araneus ventricosus]|uniref:Uncharacterized protein n=1 Tax=Araneus ventricosus TaxID=182803 RepID=A0A4Y2EC86_ARAVE|nr:hypothetical protein AVEN_120341-1 [Araneus ventricosus]GBN61086.1 hypothetical protein AVEN_96806-1 [Araneus ventricosus]